ncbi:hypothetical protein AQI88_08460 [Streptomyces cellostaticus]|uniref:Uncharacterized protein n=1 Tax=Streptomyces cellostaticus TaxID=67285 RepID=A0A117PXG6_9ACTN|nr:hypothetical protein [Streptomyces cellostaticus]KUM97295.1 hypothetical protein AQI88_08460 [Streptomyces cellostaticus]GHI03906.1 hypothetical protein Scel_22270 [Streptomyces cellostaticus]
MTRFSASPATPVGRRAVLWAVAGAALGAAAGCSGAAASRARPAPWSSGTASPWPSPALPRTTAWRPTSAEVDPEVKLRAVRLVEAIGAWPYGHGGRAAARSRVAALGLGLPRDLVDQAGPLLPAADQAALQVVDAQYGGILARSASVPVVCRQWTRHSATVRAGGTTVDVRLFRSARGWSVDALHPARPGPAAASPAPDVRAVLSDDRITLPPAAAADLRSGQVHSSVTKAMLALSGTYRLGVSVVRSGHPLDVFGTSRPSDHPRGRAFDVWQIDGHTVVLPTTPRSLIERFMRDAAAAGSYNVGGPVLLTGGSPGQFFSDATHHDHVHIGFRS